MVHAIINNNPAPLTQGPGAYFDLRIGILPTATFNYLICWIAVCRLWLEFGLGLVPGLVLGLYQ